MWPFNQRLFNPRIYSPCTCNGEEGKREGKWRMLICGWSVRTTVSMRVGEEKKYHHGNPHHAVARFFSYPLHFALLISPFSLSYSYHLHLFPPSFRSSTEPHCASSHLIFPSMYVTSLSTILSLSLHYGVMLSILLISRSVICHFWENPLLPLYSLGNCTTPNPPTTPTTLPQPCRKFSDLYVHISDLPA